MARQRTLGGSEVRRRGFRVLSPLVRLRAVGVNCLWAERSKRGDDLRGRRDAASACSAGRAGGQRLARGTQVLAIFPPSGAFGQNGNDSAYLRSRIQKAAGLPVYEAVLASGVSRLPPVSMAVTMIGGLGIATVLTMIVVPVLYAIFFRAQAP